MIKLSFNNSDEEVISEFRSKSQRTLARIAERLTLSMERLQEKAREKASAKSSKYPENPRNPLTGSLADSIEDPRVEITGRNVIGHLDWGGDLPYAQMQEHGGQGPVANALGAKKAIGRALGGTRKRVKGATRVFGSDVLQFMGAEGKFVYRQATFPGPIPGKHFMEYALQESVEEIKNGIQQVLSINARGK